jgi:hypothetical protein
MPIQTIFTYESAGGIEAIITGVHPGATLSGHITIPTFIGARIVTEISAGAFVNHTALISVTIPDSVRTIGDHAFSVCTALQNVNLGNGVTNIGWGAFNGTMIESIIIPKSVTNMGEWATSTGRWSSSWNENMSALSGAMNLRTVIFEEGTTAIPDYALLYWRSHANPITSVIIPASVREIGTDAFLRRNPNMTIYGVWNSYAHEFAIANDIPFDTIEAFEK